MSSTKQVQQHSCLHLQMQHGEWKPSVLLMNVFESDMIEIDKEQLQIQLSMIDKNHCTSRARKIWKIQNVKQNKLNKTVVCIFRCSTGAEAFCFAHECVQDLVDSNLCGLTVAE